VSAIAFTILGEAASKANSRAIVARRSRTAIGAVTSRPMSIKSDKALAFERAALRQVPVPCRVRLAGPLRITLKLFYTSERPDLDESLVLDVLQDRWAYVRRDGVPVRERVQDGVYRNDRQIREKHVYHGIDRTNPRVEIVVESLAEPSCAWHAGLNVPQHVSGAAR
jgi:Holliday junction resolvase RusA-like endonuclease